MIFKGILREFSLENESQYDTIGAFWDEMSEVHGLENLLGLGFGWSNGKIKYAIGKKNGDISGYNASVELPDDNWQLVQGKTEELKKIYDEIYKDGRLDYEIEEFYESGDCIIRFQRKIGK